MNYEIIGDFFDGFDVVYSNGYSTINNKKQPAGYYAAQAVMIDSDILYNLRKAVHLFGEDIEKYTKQKTALSLGFVQGSLEELWSTLKQLPVYELFADDNKYISVLETVFNNDDVFVKGGEANISFNSWKHRLDMLEEKLFGYSENTIGMIENYFDGLKSRKPADYAKAFEAFKQDTYNILNSDNIDKIENATVNYTEFEFPIKMSFVLTQDEEGNTILAERMTFNDLVSFLHYDLFKGMMEGNLPRRCHHCKRYFLAKGGYNSMYCDKVAPGETDKTCKQVAAHIKERHTNQNNAFRKEYMKVYNRLKGRKFHGKINEEQWKIYVAQAQRIVEMGENEKITFQEMTELLNKI